jgi:cation-transporting ATPase V
VRDGKPEVDDLQRRLVVSAFCSAYVLLFSLAIAPGSRLSLIMAMAAATPVQLYGGWPFFRGAVRAARHRTSTMDTLIAVGSLSAFLYSSLAAMRGHHAYFDTSAMIVTLILLGKVLESRARLRAGDAARLLLERQPREATVLDGEAERRVPAEDLRVGDVVVVLPAEQIPADGVVREGASAVDLSLLTGEAVPVDVGPGDAVIGAALNGHGRLVVELTRVGSQTRLAEIVRLLEVTQASKAPIQRLADRIAAVFVPRVLQVAGAVFVLMLLFGSNGIGDAMLRAAAVVLVACPCSLGLATPVAIMAGSGRAAQLGILFKGGEVFEAARRIDAVLIDKTGTLTEGAMSVHDVIAVTGEPDRVLALAAAAESGSGHPIARSVVRAAADRGLDCPPASGHRAESGSGVSATVEGVMVRVGRPDGLPDGLTARAEALSEQALTVFGVWRDGRPIGLIALRDKVKPGAAELVRRLRLNGWDVALVSGDRRAAARAVAREVGIERVVGEVRPEGKVDEVRRLQAEGRRVAMIGDGINDAPALAQADLGMALGTGTDVTMAAGGVLIMGTDIRLVAESLGLAAQTFRVIAQNLVWAFAYNSLMIPMAVVGRVSPLLASGVMAASSVCVVGNALRLLRYGASREAARQEASPARSSVDVLRPAGLEAGPALTEGPPARELDHSGPPADDDVSKEAPRREGEPVPASPGGFLRGEGKRIGSALGRMFENQWEI